MVELFLKLELTYFNSPLSAMGNCSCSHLAAMKIEICPLTLLSVCGTRFHHSHGLGVISKRNGENSVGAESQMEAVSN